MNHFPPQPILFKQRMSFCNRTICHPLFLKMGLFLEIAVTRLPRKMEPCSVIRLVASEATLSERHTNLFYHFTHVAESVDETGQPNQLNSHLCTLRLFFFLTA